MKKTVKSICCVLSAFILAAANCSFDSAVIQAAEQKTTQAAKIYDNRCKA